MRLPVAADRGEHAGDVPAAAALALLRRAYRSESYGPIMAGAALSALPQPVGLVVANRRIVEEVRLSGPKG